MPNPVVHFEIPGKYHDSLEQYYRDLFRWKITNASPDFSYGLVSAEERGRGIGGGVGATPPGENPQPTVYVESRTYRHPWTGPLGWAERQSSQ